MKSFTNMSCKFIRLLETIFSSSKTMPAYLQYGKELFASWSCHTPLTGLPGPDPSKIGHPLDILGWLIHDRITSQLTHFPNLTTSWLNNGNVFHEGWVQPQAPFKHAQKPHRMYHKGGGHTNYDTIYKFIIITCSCLYLISTKR